MIPPAERPSAWWPSGTEGRIFLTAWLALCVAVPWTLGQPATGFTVAASHYLIVAGLRAMIYPQQAAGRHSPWWPATSNGRVFLVIWLAYCVVGAGATGGSPALVVSSSSASTRWSQACGR